MTTTTTPRKTEHWHVPCHTDLALDLLAGEELLCLAGQVRLSAPALHQEPGSSARPASLATGQGWRAPAACRVSITTAGHAPARLQRWPALALPAPTADGPPRTSSTSAARRRANRFAPTWLSTLWRWLSAGLARG